MKFSRKDLADNELTSRKPEKNSVTSMKVKEASKTNATARCRVTLVITLLLYISVQDLPAILILQIVMAIRSTSLAQIYSLRHRKCGVRGFIHELFVSKTRTSEVRASEGF